MSKNNSPRFVTATCKCGTQFEREVKRGRPQVWCPTCVLVPFYERTTAPVPVVMSVDEVVDEVVVTAPRVANDNDPLDAVRDNITAEIAAINVEHLRKFHELVAGGMDPYVAGPIMTAETATLYNAVYAKYR